MKNLPKKNTTADWHSYKGSDSSETKKSIHAEREERVLAYWRENDIFKKTLEKESPMGEFVFYEGPPTANGTPGIHHLEARAFKDLFPRYKTMRGYHVRRKAGWDTHGLPVELKAEKELGLDSKKKIEEYGIAAFNKKCKESVHEYIDLWKSFTERIGYWTDMEHAYFTYSPRYVESVWKVFSHVNDKGLLYKDYKVVPWCPRCGTALSSHELGQPDAYVDVKDLSVIPRFKITDGKWKDTSLLAWTTTPWTLPGNVALAVGEDIDYVRVKTGEEYSILAQARTSVLPEGFEVVEEIKGSDLVGLSYEPLYPFMKEKFGEKDEEAFQKAYKVYTADFVTTEDGIGIVHTAVMYGADDFDLGTKVGLPKFHTVDETGHFLEDMDFLSGRFVKDEDVAIDVVKDLAHRGLLFKKEKYEHAYPHCWRCKTPLLYYARDSWYIRMSSLREELARENEKVAWEPAHIKEGRMGEWLRDAKDWAISRERYWGSPMPIWETADGSERVIIDSYDTLRSLTKRSGNRYYAMRHGEGEHNVKNICSGGIDDPYRLTPKGVEEVRRAAESLRGANIDTIFISPLLRSKETALIVCDALGISEEALIVDPRLREVMWGDFQGKPFGEFLVYEEAHMKEYGDRLPGGESYQAVKNRVGEFLYEVERTYANKNILIIGHGIQLETLPAIAEGADAKRSKVIIDTLEPKTAQVMPIDFVPLPHNEHYELDPHKPFIDEIELISEKSGAPMHRVKEVMDVWFDSGAMPYAQDAEERFLATGTNTFDDIQYPADFISEAIDQTRGWFYTLLAEGVLMGRGTPYRNVVCLGHLLDASGKKMSKSLGNVVDPWVQMEKYGADALRLWMYSVNQPGDSKNYDEKTVDELVKKVFLILGNCHTFYDTYRESAPATYEEAKKVALSSGNILDVWILSLLGKMISDGTRALESYDSFKPTRLLRDFANDFSTWYIRRSRERFKGDDAEDKRNALATTKYILIELAKYMAPFTPFFAEELYQKTTEGSLQASVHLEAWPGGETVSQELERESVLSRMEDVRRLVSLGLEARQRAGMKVRQPLASLTVSQVELSDDHLVLLRDEVNVKEIKFDSSLPPDGAVLDTVLTESLKQEGALREFMRAIQDMRKEMGLMPEDSITLLVDPNESLKTLFASSTDVLQKTVGAKEIVFEANNGKEVADGEYRGVIEIRKA